MSKIKAIIFDLDDTLFDCTGLLIPHARERAARAIFDIISKEKIKIKNIKNFTEKGILARINIIGKRYGAREHLFDKVCEELGIKEKKAEKIVDAALNAYQSDDVEDIYLFEDVPQTLDKLKKKNIKLVLITSGRYRRQERKIEMLGLKRWFDVILIRDIEGPPLETFFKTAIQRLKLKPEEILSVGDRINYEIKISNKLGMKTARMLSGRFKNLSPRNDLEEADYSIKKISQILSLLEKIEKKKDLKHLKIVAIGGGTGIPTVLSGLKEHTNNLTAIVTVADTGRSSGILRKDLEMLPPGDIRNCLVALSDVELKKLFQYRFDAGNLKGHSFGNLFIAALTKLTGSFERAIKETSKILAIKGKVIPSTLQDVNIGVELENGQTIIGENNIIDRSKKALARPKIKNTFLIPKNVKATAEAINEIKDADVIIIGPGSLFTSIIPNLLISQISREIKKSRAVKIYICNVMTQACQTHNFTILDHIKEILKYTNLDYVIINKKIPAYSILKKYEKEGAYILKLEKGEIEKIKRLNISPVIANVIEERKKARKEWEKSDWLRHDSGRLANIILSIIKNY